MSHIIISGGGLIGLTTAIALAQAGFAVTVVESQFTSGHTMPQQDAPMDLRVVALNQASIHFLTKLNVWPSIARARFGRLERMQVWDAVADGQIAFSDHHLEDTLLGAIVEQKVCLAALWEQLQQYPAIRVVMGAQISAFETQTNQIKACLSNGEVLLGELVVVAEGARSPLRAKLSIETDEQSYEQTALVATIRGEKKHSHTAYQRFGPDGPLAWLPLSDPFLTSIVWSTTPARAHHLMALSTDQFNDVLTRESAGVMGALTLEGERKTFPLKSMHAKQYFRSRCVLVGDAAHTIHPLAGQGLNCGFRDVRCLLETLQKAQDKKRDIGSERVLRRYQREAKWHNQIMRAAMWGFHRGFTTQNTLVCSLRNAGFNFLDHQKRLKALFIRAAQGA